MASRNRIIECTAYCSCGHCCKWEWGLKLPGPWYMSFAPSIIPFRIRKRRKGWVQKTSLPLFSRYWTSTTVTGEPYHGFTAKGNFPSQARPGILSPQSIRNYQKIPGRLILFPWRLLSRDGTIAADTKYYPFGTRMYVPGYGWGIVEDKGSAIKGPARIDLYHHSHSDALKWGRRTVKVLVIPPGKSVVDYLKVPEPVKIVLKGVHFVTRLFF